MAVAIRLTRVGATKRPAYRVIAIDKRRSRDGRAIEILGFYDPLTDPATVQLDTDKIKAWIGNGAQPSDMVVRLMRQVEQAAQGETKPKKGAKPKPSKKAQAKAAATSEPAASAASAPAATATAETEPVVEGETEPVAEAVEETPDATVEEATTEAASSAEAEAPDGGADTSPAEAAPEGTDDSEKAEA